MRGARHRRSHLPIRYEIQPNLVRVVIDDVLDAHEILTFYASIAGDPAFQPGTPFLVDARGVNSVAPLDQLRGTAVEAQRTPAFAEATKSAALVSSALMFGIVRQWAALSGDGNLETRPFYDEAEALRWLGG